VRFLFRRIASTGTIHDDAGREFPEPTFAQLRENAGKDGYPALRFYKLLEEAARLQTVRTTWLDVATAPLAVCGLCVFPGVIRAVSGLPILASLVISLVLTTAVMNLISRRVLSRPDDVVRTLVLRGVCGACGYLLRGIPRGDTNHVTCPECGARWNAARITKPAWQPGAFSESAPFPAPLRSMFNSGPAREVGTDHRGALAIVVRSWLGVRRGVRKANATREQVRAIVRRMRSQGKKGRLIIAAAVVVGPALFVAILLATGSTPVDGVGFAIITAVVCVPIAFAALGSDLFIKRDAGIAAALWHSRCPCCLAGLEDQPLAADGLTDCPVCGCGWRVEEERTIGAEG